MLCSSYLFYFIFTPINETNVTVMISLAKYLVKISVRIPTSLFEANCQYSNYIKFEVIVIIEVLFF